MYRVEFAAGALEDLRKIRAYDRAAILDAIEEQLTREPTVPTRQRKVLAGVEPPFEAVPPIWQLRAGGYRVFYDVDEEEQVTYVRAIRKKPSHKTTEGIL